MFTYIAFAFHIHHIHFGIPCPSGHSCAKQDKQKHATVWYVSKVLKYLKGNSEIG